MFLLPLAPFTHRITYHVPHFLFLVFVGTLIYNLVVFPFNDANRYKAYFVQRVNLETGQNIVSLAGLEEFNRLIIATLPSASGQSISCEEDEKVRADLKFCTYAGLPPKVVPNDVPGAPPEESYASWLSLNTSRVPNENKATFSLSGRNTRACVLRFARPIKSFSVHGAAPPDPRFDAVPPDGTDEVRLWHREWDQPWVVDVEWFPGEDDGQEVRGMEGKAVCLWSDENVEGVIPALDEVRMFAPTWSTVTKIADGLVEGWKGFVV